MAESLVPAESSPNGITPVSLPEQVPYLNEKHRYTVGNGVVLMVGEPDGTWTDLVGPGYSSTDLLKSESLELEVDGVKHPIQLEMKRAEKTGLYYGVKVFGDLRVRLVDFARRGQPWISRLALIDNTSGSTEHDVRLRARIVPHIYKGMTNWLVQDAGSGPCGFAIQADTTAANSFYGVTNARNKLVLISFSEPGGQASLAPPATATASPTATVETSMAHLDAGKSWNIALVHYLPEDKTPDAQSLAALRSVGNVADLGRSVAEWQAWCDNVGANYRIDNIKDERARRMVEGGLVILKTNQSLDGGIIAHTTHYRQGFHT